MTIRIQIEDLADPKSFVCRRVKAWFRRHDLDWGDFKKNGIDLETLHSLNDQRGMIDKLEQTAIRRMSKGA